MSKDHDRIVISRLFIAVPELTFNWRFLDRLVDLGLITPGERDTYKSYRRQYRRLNRLSGNMAGKSLAQRLLLVAPELLSTATVDLLRLTGLIDEKLGHELRILLRFEHLLGTWNDRTVIRKLAQLLGVGISDEMIDLLRARGDISVAEANIFRGYIASGKSIRLTLAELRSAKSLTDALLLLGSSLIDAQLIRNLVRAGVLSPRTAAVYLDAVQVGTRSWRVFDGARRAQGFQQRLILAMTGSLNSDVLDVLFKYGYIDKKYRHMFRFAEIIAGRINDRMLEDLTQRKHRVNPNERPIATFLRTSRRTDGELLRLLAQAAKESAELAAAMDVEKVGGAVRARQLQATRGALFAAMQEAWEGVGYLTIFGEKEAAEAAAESVDILSRKLLGPVIGKSARDSILYQSKAGVDAYISRQENIRQLSARVYKNIPLYSGEVYKRVNIGLLTGKSAAEIAKDVERYINPSVEGGVRYAAMRLARTEIANAFHLSQIRFTREQPWVRGYQWHLSGSHPSSRPDICNDYAEQDGYDMGRGVFPKSSVPNKPHPNCLCYITTVVMSQDEMMSAMAAGRFDRYFKSVGDGSINSDVVPGDTSFMGTTFAIAQFGVTKTFGQ